jgi:hypothetical protein
MCELLVGLGAARRVPHLRFLFHYRGHRVDVGLGGASHE